MSKQLNLTYIRDIKTNGYLPNLVNIIRLLNLSFYSSWENIFKYWESALGIITDSSNYEEVNYIKGIKRHITKGLAIWKLSNRLNIMVLFT